MVLKIESLHVAVVEIGFMGSFYCVHEVPLDMVRMITLCEIVLPLSLEEERVIKLLLMFQNAMLQIRGISMHSRIKEQWWIQMRMRMMVCLYNLFSGMSSFYVGEYGE